MRSFTFVKLEPNEEMVFGPVTTSKSFSVGGTPNQRTGAVPIDKMATQQQLTHTSGRTVGVTTQRVVIEDLKDSGKTRTIPNDQVQRIFIKTKHRKGQASLTLEKVEVISGQSIKLDIKGLPVQAEDTLNENFPQAEIVHGKGGSGSTWLKIVAIIAAVGVFMLCILPVLVSLIGQLFTN